MNADFSRILTLLRHERKISQKQAAADLGISQALLSHYEKGIRECGLDFVLRAAEYYSVSCDYLLGRTTDRNGAKINIEDIPDASASTPAFGMLTALHHKLIVNSLKIIYNILEQSGSKQLTTEVSTYLMTAVYEMFRILYSSDRQNPQDVFSVGEDMQRALAVSLQALTESAVCNMLSQKRVKMPDLTPDSLSQICPDEISSLYNLLRMVETSMTRCHAPF